MWRPDDWKNPHTRISHELEPELKTVEIPDERFEAGADAMLISLRARGERIAAHCGFFEGDIQEESGTWVFIPDET